MTQPTNTFDRYDAIGVKEELSDVITNISPEETPGISNGRKASCHNTYFEWQTDALAAADEDNKHIDGDDTAADAVVPTVRLGNYTQIMKKVLVISGTLEAVSKAGRKAEMAYQIAKAGAEIKRDMEARLFANQGNVGGSSSVARETAGFGAWIKTNVDKGASGTNPVYTVTPDDPRNDDSTRAFTEAILKAVVASCFTEGGTPTILMVGPSQKQVVSGFSGVATKTIDQSAAKPAVIIGAADFYVSDFGTLHIVPNRFQRDRDAWVLDPEYYGLCYLRKFKVEKLAKTGDSEKRHLIVEFGTKVYSEKAHGLAADLT